MCFIAACTYLDIGIYCYISPVTGVTPVFGVKDAVGVSSFAPVSSNADSRNPCKMITDGGYGTMVLRGIDINCGPG